MTITKFLFLASSDQAKHGLYNAQNYIHYQDFYMWPINTIEWWIVKFIYGLANFASSLLNHVVGTSSFLTKGLSGSGQLATWISNARSAAIMVATAYLIWVAIKMVVAKEPPQFKNVIIQLCTAIFLILSTGDITTTLVSQTTDWYQGFTQTDTNKNANSKNKDVSDLPFDMLAGSTNDVEYLIGHQFDGTKAPAKQKVNIDTSKVMDKTPRVKYGFNDLNKTEVNEGRVPFDQVITWPDVDNGGSLSKLDGDDWKKKVDSGDFIFGWLKYHSQSYKDDKDKLQVDAPDIPRIGTTIFSFGGYPRFTVDFFPLVLSLGALIIAYLFAAYAIVKSYLELGLMQILAVFLFAVDLDSGSKTKQVIQAIFSTSLLVALQGLEIAFYKIAMLWGMNAKNDGTMGDGITAAWVFVVFAAAATIMLITGSQKVSQFFGVDTGAQHGWAAAGSVMYAGKQLAKGAGKIASAPIKGAKMAKATRDNIGHALNTKGSMKRDANQQAKDATRQQAVDRMAGTNRYGEPVGGDAEDTAYQPKTSSGSNFNNTSDGQKLGDMASQIQQTPSAKKAQAKTLNKAARASQQALNNQAKRGAIAHNMKVAGHNAAAKLNGGKKAPYQSMPMSNSTKQLAKPYSSMDPEAKGMTYQRKPGIEGTAQDAKRALGANVTPSARTSELQHQLKDDQQALNNARLSNAPESEKQMLKDNVESTRHALDQSIAADNNNNAKLANAPKISNVSAPKPNKQNITRNQKSVGSNITRNQKSIDSNNATKHKQARLSQPKINSDKPKDTKIK